MQCNFVMDWLEVYTSNQYQIILSILLGSINFQTGQGYLRLYMLLSFYEVCYACVSHCVCHALFITLSSDMTLYKIAPFSERIFWHQKCLSKWFLGEETGASLKFGWCPRSIFSQWSLNQSINWSSNDVFVHLNMNQNIWVKWSIVTLVK